MTGLRFGIVSESVLQGRAWLDYARQPEDAGIGVLHRPNASAACLTSSSAVTAASTSTTNSTMTTGITIAR